MNYELAKELKDAGFPQEEGAGEVIDDEGLPAKPGVYEGRLYVPILSELIEACGESFRRLEVTLLPSVKWHCVGVDIPGSLDVFSEVHGTTPEEAVAHLWIALNTT